MSELAGLMGLGDGQPNAQPLTVEVLNKAIQTIWDDGERLYAEQRERAVHFAQIARDYDLDALPREALLLIQKAAEYGPLCVPAKTADWLGGELAKVKRA